MLIERHFLLYLFNANIMVGLFLIVFLHILFKTQPIGLSRFGHNSMWWMDGYLVDNCVFHFILNIRI